MKVTTLLSAMAALFVAGQINAATITGQTPEGADPVAGGISYRWYVGLSGSDSGFFIDHVGAWSWEDNSLFDPTKGQSAVGWTHTSNWVALNLAEDTIFTLRVERKVGVPWPDPFNNPDQVASTENMNPSFTIWSGVDNDGDDFHSYNNHGNVDWAEDISYLDHYNNSTEAFVERSWTLAAGQYTIVIGSNAPSTDANRQGYQATFTATPVPEPSTITGLISGVAALALLKRRKPVNQGRE